jgi:cysteine desulfurase
MPDPIYLDHNAGASVDPLILDAVMKEMIEEGNPSSIHLHGRRSRQKLEHSREVIAKFLAVRPSELTFTSGGTEGANFLLKAWGDRNPLGHAISSDAEHSCVYNALKKLTQKGSRVSFLSAGPWGAVKPEAVQEAIRPDTSLITLMAVNNETGVKTDIESIAKIALENQIPFVVDGVALLGKELFSIPEGVTGIFFSGHKLHAPKGVGVVFCRRSSKLSPLLDGGSQEFNRRAGTENLPGIVGFGLAVELLVARQHEYTGHMLAMRDRLESSLKANLEGVIINGEGPRVVNTLNISFLGVDGEFLLMSLDREGISVSHGSACASGAIEPSRILLNMGIPRVQATGAIRFSVSRNTTPFEIDRTVEVVTRLVKSMRRK